MSEGYGTNIIIGAGDFYYGAKQRATEALVLRYADCFGDNPDDTFLTNILNADKSCVYDFNCLCFIISQKFDFSDNAHRQAIISLIHSNHDLVRIIAFYIFQTEDKTIVVSKRSTMTYDAKYNTKITDARCAAFGKLLAAFQNHPDFASALMKSGSKVVEEFITNKPGLARDVMTHNITALRTVIGHTDLRAKVATVIEADDIAIILKQAAAQDDKAFLEILTWLLQYKQTALLGTKLLNYAAQDKTGLEPNQQAVINKLCELFYNKGTTNRDLELLLDLYPRAFAQLAGEGETQKVSQLLKLSSTPAIFITGIVRVPKAANAIAKSIGYWIADLLDETDDYAQVDDLLAVPAQVPSLRNLNARYALIESVQAQFKKDCDTVKKDHEKAKVIRRVIHILAHPCFAAAS